MLSNHTEINLATTPCDILSKDITTHVVCWSYRHNYLLGKQSVMELKRQVNKWHVNHHLFALVNDPQLVYIYMHIIYANIICKHIYIYM